MYRDQTHQACAVLQSANAVLRQSRDAIERSRRIVEQSAALLEAAQVFPFKYGPHVDGSVFRPRDERDADDNA